MRTVRQIVFGVLIALYVAYVWEVYETPAERVVGFFILPGQMITRLLPEPRPDADQEPTESPGTSRPRPSDG